MKRDPFLPESFGNKEPLDFYQEGFSRLNISQENIIKFGDLMHTLTTLKIVSLGRKKLPDKGISNDHHRHLQGGIFAYGTKKVNQEWKSHSACSIREMLDLFSEDPEAFEKEYLKLFSNKIKKNKKWKSDFTQISLELRRIKFYYQYFSGIVHHQLDKTVHAYRTLENVIIDNVISVSDESFEKIFEKFFNSVNKIIDFNNKYGTN